MADLQLLHDYLSKFSFKVYFYYKLIPMENEHLKLNGVYRVVVGALKLICHNSNSCL